MLSSATACAPITAHNAAGSVTNLAAFSANDGTVSPVAGSAVGSGHHHQGLAERLQSLTERLGSLGHSRTESDASNHTRAGKNGRLPNLLPKLLKTNDLPFQA